MKQDYRQV